MELLRGQDDIELAVDLDFDAPVDAFAADPGLVQLLTRLDRRIPTVAEARNQLRRTLAGIRKRTDVAIPLRDGQHLLADVFEPEYSLLAVPVAVLAAFSLPTLRRGVVNSLDWFAVMCFSLTAATVWLGWIALQTGWPRQIAHNIARQTTGYAAHVSIAAVLIALAGTVTWICLVRWRLHSKPQALWRGTVLKAAGVRTSARYIVFTCADLYNGAPYYESIDMVDAFHPQTILAWAMNDQRLSVGHGAPVRLRVERQLGYKHAKYVAKVDAVASLDGIGAGQGGYWEDAGDYAWYAGI